MGLEAHNHAANGTDKRANKSLRNGHVRDARHDADVIRLVSAEMDKRAAALHQMIADAAYFRAEKRGFASGHEIEDWLAAEKEIVNHL